MTILPKDDQATTAPSSRSVNSLSTSAEDSDSGKSKKRRSSAFVKIWALLVQEARSVSLWCLLSILLRMSLLVLGILANYPQIKQQRNGISTGDFSATVLSILPRILREVTMILSVLSEWVLWLVPTKVATFQAPGFVYANPLLLLWVQDKTGIVPNVPIRICEYVMGRIRLLDLCMILPIHVATVVSTFVFLRQILPETSGTIGRILWIAEQPLEYTTTASERWFHDLCCEILVTTIFTVAILVLPVFCQLNHVPKWSMTLVLYPLFNFAVDGSGMASAFSPNMLLATSVLSHQPILSIVHLIGSIIGGIVGGKVMNTYFPDDSTQKRSKLG